MVRISLRNCRSGHAQGMLAQFMAETGRGKLNWKLLENEALALLYGRLPYHLDRTFLETYKDYNRALKFLKVAVDHAPEHISQVLG